MKKIKKREIKEIKTKSGKIKIPFFMPDATRGFVKSLDKNDLEKINLGPLVVNTYHLYLQPGVTTIKKSGGLHKFMNWNKSLLSDSGGYQIFSLIHKNPDRGMISDKGAFFQSPLDGKKHVLTPEKSIEIQFDLGVDMMVALDDVPPNAFSYEKIKQAVERTLCWAERCMIEYKRQIKIRKINKEDRPLIFCVIQGGEYLDLRKMCAERLMEIGSSAKGGPALEWDGYGFGARHVDKDGNFLEEVLRNTANWIPDNSLRFALGVGTPEDIIRCVAMGWDMFDCVIPTREGRHGRLFVRKARDDFSKFSEKNPSSKYEKQNFYATVNINNEKFRQDFSPVDPGCDCDLCQKHTRAYLRHLFVSKDPLAMRLASLHNLKFYMDFMKNIKSCL